MDRQVRARYSVHIDEQRLSASAALHSRRTPRYLQVVPRYPERLPKLAELDPAQLEHVVRELVRFGSIKEHADDATVIVVVIEKRSSNERLRQKLAESAAWRHVIDGTAWPPEIAWQGRYEKAKRASTDPKELMLALNSFVEHLDRASKELKGKSATLALAACKLKPEPKKHAGVPALGSQDSDALAASLWQMVKPRLRSLGKADQSAVLSLLLPKINRVLATAADLSDFMNQLEHLDLDSWLEQEIAARPTGNGGSR